MAAPRPNDPGSPLDRPFARLGALGVFFAVAALLGYIHRDDLFPPPAPAVDPNDPVALCLAERAPGIEVMLADGTIDERQAALFMSRAEALCQAQAGQANAPALSAPPAQ
jgi:hypothetical protein